MWPARTVVSLDDHLLLADGWPSAQKTHQGKELRWDNPARMRGFRALFAQRVGTYIPKRLSPERIEKESKVTGGERVIPMQN